MLLCVVSCRSHSRDSIAMIPQTEGNMIWESAHVGAAIAADRTGASIYWIAPMREDDAEAQIALVDRVADGGYRGLVLAPDQALSLISPVRRVLARGIPTVIISSPLPIPADGSLSYILNDDEQGGQMAAKRVIELLRGHGTVAVLGIDPDITGTMIRDRAFEEFLAQNASEIHVVERRVGSFNFPHEQQAAEDVLREHPDLDIIVALMATSVDGSLSALHASSLRHGTRVIGFDVGGMPSFEHNPELDCVIQGDSHAMGEKAIELIEAKLHGKPTSEVTHIAPRILTQSNIDSPEIRDMLAQDWTLGHLHWSSIQ